MILRLLWLALAVIFGTVLFWLGPVKLVSRLFDWIGLSLPCPAAIAPLLDHPLRRRYMHGVLDRIGIQPGERVLELGPGAGAFTVEAAGRTGPTGQLVAVDTQSRMIDFVQRRVAENCLANVETHVADAYDLPVGDGSVDRAFLVAVLPEIPDQGRALAELRRVLKPQGILSITEEFPDPDYRFASETIRRVEAAGFRLDQRYGNFWVYTLNFRRVGQESVG